MERETEARRTQSEILKFIQEAVVNVGGPVSGLLSGDEAARVVDAKAILNEVVRDFDSILKRIDDTALFSDILERLNDALLHAYILGNYSTPSEGIWQLHGRQYGRRQRQTAGKSSGRVRGETAAQTWKPHALDLAKTIRREQPSIAQTDLKEEIVSRWRQKIHCPETQLIKAISRWENEGELPRRNNDEPVLRDWLRLSAWIGCTALLKRERPGPRMRRFPAIHIRGAKRAREPSAAGGRFPSERRSVLR